MASPALKYGARASALGLFAWGVLTWNTARTLQEQALALAALGVALCILAPTLPKDYRPPMYAFGGAVLIAGVGLWLVAENSDQRAALGSGVHDGRTAAAPPSSSGPQTNPARLIPAARVEVVEWGVWLDGVPEALSVREAVDLLAESLPRGALVEVDMTAGIVDVWPDLEAELQDFGFQPYKTIRRAEDR